MHDGWSENGTHYLRIIAVYMKKVNYWHEGVQVEREELCTTVLS